MDLNNCLNYLLTISQNIVFQHFQQLLSKYDITPAQCGVLNCLWDRGNLTPTEIRTILHLEPSSISGLLERMEKKGLITRKLSQNNKRKIIVSPTEKTLKIKNEVENIILELNNRFLNEFNKNEQEILKKCLINIIEKKVPKK